MSSANAEGLNALSFPGSRTRHLTWAMGLTTDAGVKLNPTARRTFCGRPVGKAAQLVPVTVKYGDRAFCGSCMNSFRRHVRHLVAAFAPKIRPLGL
jgi:hypothetical protein